MMHMEGDMQWMPSLMPVDSWLDIESAPNDGTPVILWSPDTHTYAHFGRYWAQDDEWQEDADHTKTNPTHWMPLPEGPN